ncbi:hypothetical protein ACFSKY_20005 [Azotobacter chroococcum]
MNLFTIKGVVLNATMGEIIRGSLPFVVLMTLGMLLVLLFPQVARESFRRGQELAGQRREVCHALHICVPIPSSSRQGHHPLREAGHGRAAWSRGVEPGSGRLHALRPPLSLDGRRLARRFSAAWQTPSGCRRGRWGRSAPVLASPVRENRSPVLEAGVRRRSGAGPMTPCLRAARRCAAALRADGHGS